jgi:GTPase
VQEAALILHVTDISDPHHAEHDAEVLGVLRQLGVEDRPRLHVLNKIDRLSEQDLEALTDSNGRGADTAFVSAIAGAGLDELLKKIDAAMPVDPLVRLHLRLPLADGRSLAVVQGRGRVLRSEVHDGSLELEAEIPESAARELREFILK